MLWEKWCQQTCHNPAICLKTKNKSVIKRGMQHWPGLPQEDWGDRTHLAHAEVCGKGMEGSWETVVATRGPLRVSFYRSGRRENSEAPETPSTRVRAQSLRRVRCDPRDCSPPGSSRHETLQARVLEWGAMPSSRGSSRPKDQTHISCTAGGFFTAELPGKPPE